MLRAGKFRGNLTQLQLDIILKFSRMRNPQVCQRMTMFFVQGIPCKDIAAYTDSDLSNIYRDINKLCILLRLITLFIEYEKLK